MNDFKKIQTAMEKQFNKMSKESDFLYTLNLEKNELWDIYLNSFPPGTNEIFRKQRENNCSCCRHFINAFGDTVAIIDNKIVSLWDFEIDDEAYGPVAKAMSEHIKNKAIGDVFASRFDKIGTAKNHEERDGKVITWDHFNITLPAKFVNNSNDSIATFKSKYRDIKNVFKRSLEEISQESILTILELISQNSLYKGEEWKNILADFNNYHKEYAVLEDKDKDIFLWQKSTSVGAVIGKIRNHSIGTLLVNVTEGMDLDLAVKKYESIVAPTNYKRPKPIYTQKMLEDAKKKIEELGFMDSLQRRFAILEDISVNNVLFANRDTVNRLQTTDVFEEMAQETKTNPKNFNKVEEVSIQDFIDKILPTTTKIEVFLENKHAPNMVSLIAPYKADSKSMFKWNNNFCWAYSGNITDSDIKKNVKSAGGNVDGVLRFSIQWNDGNEHNRDDYDAHCVEPNGNNIYYGNRNNYSTTGNLDVDLIFPVKGMAAVENITWTNKSKMEKGTYRFFVHDFSHRGGKDGFRAEIEYNGQQFKFDYPHALRQDERVEVAEVTFDGQNFTINEKLSSSVSSREIWNLKTNNFVPVSVMMYSPNYWDAQKGIGNKHIMIMLKGCINDEAPNGFFVEFLNNDLIENRKVFEALGSKMKVDSVDSQMSGVGFSTTQRNSVVLRIEGQTKRLVKVKI